MTYSKEEMIYINAMENPILEYMYRKNKWYCEECNKEEPFSVFYNQAVQEFNQCDNCKTLYVVTDDPYSPSPL